MAIRIKSTWFKPGREHSLEELAGAVYFALWKITDHALKHTRKAGFDIEVGPQYFAFFAEFLIFCIQVADRIAYRDLGPEKRAEFTPLLAQRVAENYAENRAEFLGDGDATSLRRQFIDQLNARAEGYADFSYDQTGPDYRFLRYLGFCMDGIFSPQDQGWIIDQMITVAAPEAVEAMEKTFRNIRETEPRPQRRRSTMSGE